MYRVHIYFYFDLTYFEHRNINETHFSVFESETQTSREENENFSYAQS